MDVCINMFTRLPSAGTDGRGGWRLLRQGLNLWGHRKCQDGVGMEEQLVQNETRQCLQALLFAVSMGPAARSASADPGTTGTAGRPIATSTSQETQKATYGPRRPARAFCLK